MARYVYQLVSWGGVPDGRYLSETGFGVQNLEEAKVYKRRLPFKGTNFEGVGMEINEIEVRLTPVGTTVLHP